MMKKLLLIAGFLFTQIMFSQVTDTGDKVGIGTSSPSTKLHIVQNNDPGIDQGLLISEEGNNVQILLHLANNNTNGQYGYFNLGGNTILRGNGQVSHFDGKIGIGTSNPDAKLEVRGTTSIGGAWNPSQSIFNISDGANNLIMDTNEIYSSGSLYFGSKSTDIAVFRSITDTGKTDRVTIKSDGKVGIGISNPQATFHVVDNSPLGSNIGNFQILSRLQGKSNNNNFMDNIWLLRDDNGNDWLSTRLHNGISVDNSFLTPSIDTKTWWERDPWDNVQSWGNGSEVYMSLVKGKLGIGTTDPGTWKLAVNGNIRAKEIKVIVGHLQFLRSVFYQLDM